MNSNVFDYFLKPSLVYICLISSVFLRAQDYQQLYSKECNKTLSFYKKNEGYFNEAGKTSDCTPEFLFAIVAPEISQFNYIQNKLESDMLRILYIHGGEKYADFSVGFFQMKPSFIRHMEDSLPHYSCLQGKYNYCLFEKPDSKDARIVRINRLSQLSWQLVYLNLFCDLLKMRFPEKQELPSEEKIRFFASAYNTGFYKPEQIIVSMQQKAIFPHFSRKKYKYSDISEWFYIIIHEL